MPKIIYFLLLMPMVGLCHPGVGIVKDSKGNIFYTDLMQIWKISNGRKSVVVSNVHTHELYIDQNDNLYGENEVYDETTNKFFHSFWVLSPSGKLKTIIKRTEAYVSPDYSLARDREGNEYYTKRFLKPPDTTHIFRRSTDGNEIIIASGKFDDVNWLHPQESGNVLFVSHKNIYKLDPSGKITLVKSNINEFSSRPIKIWGLWEDKYQNIYVAVLSEKIVKRIDSDNGEVTDYYRSTKNWFPLHGIFSDNKLWLLEGSEKNEARVTAIEKDRKQMPLIQNITWIHFFICAVVSTIIILIFKTWKKRNMLDSAD